MFIVYNSGIWSCYQSYEQFKLTAEYKHVIRITAKINIYSWHDEILLYKLWQQVIKLLFIKTFSVSYKWNYDRSVKESSLSPPGGIHTQESALASASHLQQGEIKPWVLNCTQQDLPTGGKKKTLGICKAIWLVGLLHLH